MKTKWVWILLCVSIVFNALFTAGFLRARSHAHQFKGFEGRARRIAQRLELDAEQQKVFDRLLAQTMEERKKLHAEIRPMREQFLAELVKDEPDQAVLQAYLDQGHHMKRRKLMIQTSRRVDENLTAGTAQEIRGIDTETMGTTIGSAFLRRLMQHLQ